MRTALVFNYFAYVAVRVVVCVIQAVPLAACDAWAGRLAWALWNVVPLRRGVVDDNLKVAFPHLDAAGRREIGIGMWKHLLLMLAEIAHAPRKIHRANWRDHLAMPQMALMVRRLLDRRPVVIISGHLGNFEMGGYLLGLHGFPTHTIARPLDNPLLDRWVNQFRARTGQFILPKQGSSGRIDALLKSGGTVVLLGDQFAAAGACWVDFFGKPASTNKAVALFTLVGEAPTTVGATYRAGGPMQFVMHVEDQVDPLAPGFELDSAPLLTAWYTASLEKMIRRAPDQYWWLHRRWKGAPPERRARRSQPVAA
jgi:Kdo2-lipid IVA lauroyltransferase/acyltransferase